MRIAVVASDEKSTCNAALAMLAETLRHAGWRLAGTVQTNLERLGHHYCDMDVKVLPDGPVIRISQNLGKEARGCRLDTHALETAVAAVEVSFSADVDLLIINKFGKHEAEGRGFRTLIAEALAQDVPVICGVNDLNLGAFKAFTGSAVNVLPADPKAILTWLRQAQESNTLSVA